jgi:hypothetical protein
MAPPGAAAVSNDSVVMMEHSDNRPIGQLPWEAYQRMQGTAAMGRLQSIGSRAMVHAASMHRINSFRDVSGGGSSLGGGLPSSRHTSGGGGHSGHSAAASYRNSSVGSPVLTIGIEHATRGSSTGIARPAGTAAPKAQRRSSTTVSHSTAQTPIVPSSRTAGVQLASPTAAGSSKPGWASPTRSGARRSSAGRRLSNGTTAPGDPFVLPVSRYTETATSQTEENAVKSGAHPVARHPADITVVIPSTPSIGSAAAPGAVSSPGTVNPSHTLNVSAAAAAAAATTPAVVEQSSAETSAPQGSVMYYVNPNAIGALKSMPSEGGALTGGKSGRDSADEEDDESYVKSRISVVKRLRNFAVAGLHLFQHTDHIGPDHSKSRRATSQGGAVAPASSATSRKWANAGHRVALVAGLNSKVSMDVAAAQTCKDIAVIERLRLVTRWDFDVFEFSSNTEARPLAYIGYELFVRFKLFEQLHVHEQVFTAFINRLEHLYCFDPSKPNPYHTSLHAADVVQAVGHFLTVPRLSHILDCLDAYSVLVSAIIHDFRHPGVSNNFLVKTSHAIALRYNDESVLENFHAAEAFAVMANERHDISATLTPQQRSTSRFTIIKTVLATDLAQVR